jgi:PIN domain nuclease of toxin-antitoxin system
VIVLDTHAWLWWLADPDRLSTRARDAIADSPAIGISTISIWELATLASHKRIALDRDVRDWVGLALSGDERLEAIAPGREVALDAALLDSREFPGDPADRLIFATARSRRAQLVTRDEQLRRFSPSETTW